MTTAECAIFLCGYIRGVLSNLPDRNWEEEIEVHSVLKQLGCPAKYLPPVRKK